MSQFLQFVRHAPQKGGSGILLPIILALGAVAFTGAGGLIVRANTQHLIEIRKWLEHSHSILTNLQTTSQRLDRIDYVMQLYKATGNDDDLQSAQSTATLMHVGAGSLRNLVQDNPSQARHAEELEAELHQLDQALGNVAQSRTAVDHKLRGCRRIVNVIQDEERALF